MLSKRVEGTEGKVSLLIEAYGKFLAAGIIGAVEVEGLKSKPIILEPVRSFFFIPFFEPTFDRHGE